MINIRSEIYVAYTLVTLIRRIWILAKKTLLYKDQILAFHWYTIFEKHRIIFSFAGIRRHSAID